MTIKTSTGNTVTIGLDSSTTYHQQADATASDVTAGKTVILQLAGRRFRRGNGNGNGNAATATATAARQRWNRERWHRERRADPRHGERCHRRPLSEDLNKPCTCSWSRTTNASPAP